METKTVAIIVALVLAVIILVIFVSMMISGGEWGISTIKDMIGNWLKPPEQ